MKTLISTLILFFALSICAVAQTTTNVPGVTLSGPVGDPTVTNHSGKAVIAALVVFTPADKKPWVHHRLFTHDTLGLPDGGSEQLSANFAHQKKESPIVSVTIKAVIFADGEFRGEDSYEDAAGKTIPDAFQSTVEKEMQAMRRLLGMAKAGDWAGVKAEAESTEGAGDGRMFGGRLIFEHDHFGNDQTVAKMAHWGLLPASTWKAGLLNRLRIVPDVFQAIAFRFTRCRLSIV